ncbi:MAG: hypothetical protein HUU02_15630, partial [Bacteroidetes bacterium]|nr:hypothetical protein [Bacteroidota bacterium]
LPLLVATISFVAVNMLALTVVPTYQFLMVKGQQMKNAAMQLTNVTVTFGLFFLLHDALGFYAIIIAYAAAILCSYTLANIFKVRSGISTVGQLFQQRRILVLLAFLMVMDLAIDRSMRGGMSSIAVIIAANLCATLLVFRFQRYFTPQDVERYFGQFPALHRMMRTVLVQA